MVAGAVVKRPLTFVVAARLEPCPGAVALRIANDQQQFDEPGRHRISRSGKPNLAVLVEIGARGAVACDLAQRCEGAGGRGRSARVLHEHRAQPLSDAANKGEVVGPQFGIGCQQAAGHQPGLSIDRIGEPVRPFGQLNRVDQRLNAVQWLGRRLGLGVPIQCVCGDGMTSV